MGVEIHITQEILSMFSSPVAVVTVINSNKEPVADVVVMLGDKKETTTITGKVIFEGLKPGAHKISVKTDDHVIDNIDVIHLKRGKEAICTIVLPNKNYNKHSAGDELQNRDNIAETTGTLSIAEKGIPPSSDLKTELSSKKHVTDNKLENIDTKAIPNTDVRSCIGQTVTITAAGITNGQGFGWVGSSGWGVVGPDMLKGSKAKCVGVTDTTPPQLVVIKAR